MGKQKPKSEGAAVSHCLKLMERTSLEVSKTYMEMKARDEIKKRLDDINESLVHMEGQDEEWLKLSPVRKKHLTEELQRNDALLKRNEEKLDQQVHIGLLKLGLPESSQMWTTIVYHMRAKITELKLKIESGMEVINPPFKYQTFPEWKKLQLEFSEESLKKEKDNLQAIEENVNIVKGNISKQNEQIKQRRAVIVEELKKLGVNVEELAEKDKNYIG